MATALSESEASTSTRPAPLLLDGKATSEHLQQHELAPACAAFQAQHGRPVGLAVVVVGTRKDSATYVRMKQKTSAAVGMQSWKVQIELPEKLQRMEGERVDGVAVGLDASEQKRLEDAVVQEIYDTIRNLNDREDIDGMIVQLPLPRFCDTEAILQAITPIKDVDGLHPQNHAALFQFATRKALPPPPSANTTGKGAAREQVNFSVACTPAGCLELLDHYAIPIEGKHVVVLGRSQIVGLPVSLLCLHRNATVTMCHSKTQELPKRVRDADIVIAAIGRANFVQREWIKPGAVVIDVGINAVDDASKKSGYRLVGDVDFANVSQVAGAITPVPGGVGPMTVAMLLRNTVDSALRRIHQSTKSS